MDAKSHIGLHVSKGSLDQAVYAANDNSRWWQEISNKRTLKTTISYENIRVFYSLAVQ